MELTMENLEECFRLANAEDWEYIGIKIQMEGFPEPEIIINSFSNFDAKLAYYQKVYNDDLTLKAFNGIKIIDFMVADDFTEIKEGLILED